MLHDVGEESCIFETSESNIDHLVAESRGSLSCGRAMRLNSDTRASALAFAVTERTPWSIITQTADGMQGTCFESGSMRVVKLSKFGGVAVVAAFDSPTMGADGSDEDEHSTLSKKARLGGLRIYRTGADRADDKGIQL